MSQKILWVAGWASDLSLWQKEIQAVWNDDEHHFLSFEDWFQKDTLILPKFDSVIYWSMGIYANPNLVHIPQQMALFPALDFCGEGAWNPRIIKRMASQLLKNPPQVLQDFGRAMGLDALNLKKWSDRAAQMDVHLLAAGLLALLSPPVIQSSQWLSFASKQDQICLYTQALSLKDKGKCFELDCPHFFIQTDILTIIKSHMEISPLD